MFKILVQKIDEPQKQLWLELPLDESEIEGNLSEMLDDYDPDEQDMDVYDMQEHFDVIKVEHDYYTLDAYWKDKQCSIVNCNEIAEQLEDMTDTEYDWFLAYYYEYPTRHIIDILDVYQRYSKYWGDRSMRDVAEDIAEEGYADEFTDFTRRYFDSEAYAKDLLAGDFCETPHGILELM